MVNISDKVFRQTILSTELMLHPLEIELRDRECRDCFSTAYPWNPDDWMQYIKPGALKFKKNSRVSFYIHIPFCKNLCRFCEYTRCLVPSDIIQRNYLQIVHRDIQKFMSEYPDITLEGFDIGGGTPTALSTSNFSYLMQIFKDVIQHVKVSDNFEPSIETSVTTIEPNKIQMIKEAGISRISIGIQHGQFDKYQSSFGWVRPNAKKIIQDIKMIRECAAFKINLDFMYGFKGLSVEDAIDSERCAIEELNPDQVTLYELRTNQRDEVMAGTPDHRFSEYKLLYQMLNNMGYLGQFGRNTFSLDRDDFGVSSYLRHRMLEGGDYKGFGISAQSMSDGNVEYNIGKNSLDILSLILTGKIPNDYSFDAVEHYELPKEEKFAKFVCVSGYSGGFDWSIAKRKYFSDFFIRFGAVIDFLLDRGYIEISGNRIQLTENGFKHYGAVLSLFYNTELTTNQ